MKRIVRRSLPPVGHFKTASPEPIAKCQRTDGLRSVRNDGTAATESCEPREVDPRLRTDLRRIGPQGLADLRKGPDRTDLQGWHRSSCPATLESLLAVEGACLIARMQIEHTLLSCPPALRNCLAARTRAVDTRFGRTMEQRNTEIEACLDIRHPTPVRPSGRLWMSSLRTRPRSDALQGTMPNLFSAAAFTIQPRGSSFRILCVSMRRARGRRRCSSAVRQELKNKGELR
jgi:hypothetical protein